MIGQQYENMHPKSFSKYKFFLSVEFFLTRSMSAAEPFEHFFKSPIFFFFDFVSNAFDILISQISMFSTQCAKYLWSRIQMTLENQSQKFED